MPDMVSVWPIARGAHDPSHNATGWSAILRMPPPYPLRNATETAPLRYGRPATFVIGFGSANLADF